MEKLFSTILFLYKFSSDWLEAQSELIPQDFKNILHKLFILPNLLAVVTTASVGLLIWNYTLRGKDLNLSVEI